MHLAVELLAFNIFTLAVVRTRDLRHVAGHLLHPHLSFALLDKLAQRIRIAAMFGFVRLQEFANE